MTTSLCRLYVTITPGSDDRDISEGLVGILDAGDVACVRLRTGPDETVFPEFARKVIELAHGRDIAVLIDDDPKLAGALGADGVHLTGELAQYVDARALIGDDGIVGIDCTGSRDKAMAAGEQGADYIAFSGEDPEVVSWWTQLFEVPCVADLDGNADHARDVISGGAEFVAIACETDDDPQQCVEEIARIGHLIREIGKELN